MRTSRRIYTAFATASIVLGFTFAAALPALALAPIVPKCATQQGTAPPDLNCVKETFLNVASLIIAISGSFALLMFVYGGFTILTSGGGDGVKKGKTIIRNAVIGIFLIFLAGYIIDYGKLLLTKGEKQEASCSDPSLKDQGYVCMDPAEGKNCNATALCGAKNQQCCMPADYIDLDNVPSDTPPDWLQNYMTNQ